MNLHSTKNVRRQEITRKEKNENCTKGYMVHYHVYTFILCSPIHIFGVHTKVIHSPFILTVVLYLIQSLM